MVALSPITKIITESAILPFLFGDVVDKGIWFTLIFGFLRYSICASLAFLGLFAVGAIFVCLAQWLKEWRSEKYEEKKLDEKRAYKKKSKGKKKNKKLYESGVPVLYRRIQELRVSGI
ncbi:hypothetical protein HYALB_00009840 [Hymenoscyphus albidus]|uniref:Uncharacterized protein n=1 Tax=Hymenoscyphus albidus TaxID=595503 RepID=A0A9N9QD32_9HELO|nr:hypothetical protein HYALB_00009840 [Hymenoscyphus albidus]